MTKPVVYIVIYSLYHHVYKLSLSIKEGLESKGVDVKLFQVNETLSDETLTKMQAPPKPDLPIISIDKLTEPDGILFGLPTRFGTMPAQMKALLDASGALWAKGSLVGKFAGTFFSTASQHGGQETTALTAVTYFSHLGMMYVPFGYANNNLFNLDEVVGGSPYGCGTVSDGDGSRQPTGLELEIAKNQGANFAVVVTTFVKGRELAAGITATPAAAAATTSADSNAAPTNATTGNNAAGVNTTDPTTTTAGGSGSAVPVASAAVAGGAAGAALATDHSSTAAPTTTTSTTDGTTTTGGGVTGKTPSEIGTAAGALAAGATAATAGVAAAIGTKDKEASTTAATGTTGAGTTTADNAATTTTDAATKPSAATDIGTAAGSTAANNATATKPNAVKESLVNKSEENKPKKKKWFCCG